MTSVLAVSSGRYLPALVAKPAPITADALHRDEAMAECLAAKQPVGEYAVMRWPLKRY